MTPNRWNDSLAERLERHSMPVTECGCQVWLMSTGRGGYGQLTFRYKHMFAHRASWRAFRGEIPSGLHVLHRCNVAACINPDHLYLGRDAENAADRIAAGTQPRPPRMVGSKHPMAKIDETTAREIKRAPGRHGDIAARFGVCKSTVHHIKTGRQWGHI